MLPKFLPMGDKFHQFQGAFIRALPVNSNGAYNLGFLDMLEIAKEIGFDKINGIGSVEAVFLKLSKNERLDCIYCFSWKNSRICYSPEPCDRIRNHARSQNRYRKYIQNEKLANACKKL